MKPELKSNIIKIFFTVFFSCLSYIICEYFKISEILFNFKEDSWNVTVSIAIYGAILNIVYLYIVSLKTEVMVEIKDNKDKSNNITISDKPRRISVAVQVKGNLKKIDGKVEIIFPYWLDIMAKAVPDLSEITENKYEINLTDINSLNKETITVYFDINIKTNYDSSARNGEISSNINCRRFRYTKINKNLTINYEVD